MITPEQLARSNTEHGHQAALFCWCALSGIPELKWLFAIPNGFYATPAQKAKMKAEGLRSGVSDILLPMSSYPHDEDSYSGLFIEMKQEKYRGRHNGGLSDEQKAFAHFVTGQRYKFVVCYSWIEAKQAILSYLGKTESI